MTDRRSDRRKHQECQIQRILLWNRRNVSAFFSLVVARLWNSLFSRKTNRSLVEKTLQELNFHFWTEIAVFFLPFRRIDIFQQINSCRSRYLNVFQCNFRFFRKNIGSGIKMIEFYSRILGNVRYHAAFCELLKKKKLLFVLAFVDLKIDEFF